MNKQLLGLYGLKWNPFSPSVPTEALYRCSAINNFCWRVDHVLLREGGFAMINGEPGTGKSVALRLLAEHLKQQPDNQVGVISMPSGRLGDFYREMGDIFQIEPFIAKAIQLPSFDHAGAQGVELGAGGR